MEQRPPSKYRRRRRQRRIIRHRAKQNRAKPLMTQLAQRRFIVMTIAIVVLLFLAALRVCTQLRRRRPKFFRFLVAAIVLMTGVSLIRLTFRNPAVPTAQIFQSPKFGYNATNPPSLKQSQRLQAIVNELVNLAAEQALPIEPLSITLVDVKSRETAGYQQDQLRYPASVAKLFWMVVLYDQLEKGILPKQEALIEDVYNMIQHSDNNAASRIIDNVTQTESGSELTGESYQSWLKKRQRINQFFQSAGYNQLNLMNKTFPIAYLALEKPEGRESQLRFSPGQPTRNEITTEHAARLMYEIVTGQAVSPGASKEMTQLLARDLRPEAWQEDQEDSWGFNPIVGFLGQSLPADVRFFSKAGWTSTSRVEVAFVATNDGKSLYILAIFGNDAAYSDDWKIFPKMSLHVFNRMTDENYTISRFSYNRLSQLQQP